MSESDSSSLNSVELDGLGMAGAVDSDTGLESMSSAETPSGKPCSLCCDAQTNDSRVEGLRQDVTRLKCDKLELLRQNVVSMSTSSFVSLSFHSYYYSYPSLENLLSRFLRFLFLLFIELSTRNKEASRKRTGTTVGTNICFKRNSPVEGIVEKLHHQPQRVNGLI